MGLYDYWTDLVVAVTPWSTAEAEAPTEPAKEEESDEDNKEEADEEEEEEEELVDPKETLEEECRESKACAPAKHHFDECVERVTSAEGSDAKHEDCVEEFFHLAHCATDCAAPKLWSILK